MPRHKYRQYNQDTVKKAVEAVVRKELSLNKASKLYGIPRTTIQDKVKGLVPVEARSGPKTNLTMEEEDKLVSWATHMNEIGYGQTKRELQLVVKKILDQDGRKTQFANNLPGRDWWQRFLKRHPQLTERQGEALGKERAQLSHEKVEAWYDEFETYMKTSQDLDGKGEEILKDPNRLFNCDESGFPLSGKIEKVLAPVGSRNVYQITTSDKKQITVLACMNAAGLYLPPMLIYPGVRFRYYPLEGAPADWFMGRSGNGWIDSEVFYEWIANHFLPEVKKHGVKFPVVLLVDGHKSHVSLETAEFCNKNGIILYCFLAHASHIMQPCDLSFFRSLKGHWTKEVKEFTLQSDGQTVTKVNFAGVFAKAWKKSTIKETAMNGFRSAGIFPFNKNAYDKSKILQGEQNTNTEDCVVSEVQQQKSCPPAATAGLQAFESCISEEKKWLFEKRFAEKYDIQTDELYNVWKKLKVGSTTVEEGDQQTPEETPKPSQAGPSRISTAFEDHLRFPKAPSTSLSTKQKLNEQLPKAISGEKFRKYLKDKQQEREEEETRKQKNREEREAKKAAKEKEKQEKEKEKSLRNTGRSALEKENEEEEEEDTSDESDDEVNEVCANCGRRYRGEWEDKNWIGCVNCPRWYHRRCTDISDITSMTEEEVNAIDWFCPEC
ncbi:Tigger transposable element-derived protein 2 [Holothuria leucospilota]|uniref:Tigger transposable element-derived protein 2 n=1 Tax=Holothuria leucospilota TaxID=206669 RepID=A0A9Q1C771_HOLLE|nr:Tigger transposable element-derived protein 2 [Holothuria leucospilota]